MNRLVAGVGCRRGCSGEEIEKLVRQALGEAGRSDLLALAAPGFIGNEPGIHAATERLKVPLTLISDAALAEAAPRCATMTRATFLRRSRPSPAECAALAAAGAGSALVLARIKSARATCALAETAP